MRVDLLQWTGLEACEVIHPALFLSALFHLNHYSGTLAKSMGSE